MVGYFFQIAIANRGCTLGIATKAFNLVMQAKVTISYFVISTNCQIIIYVIKGVFLIIFATCEQQNSEKSPTNY